jgi:hypothetical protein
MGSQVLGRCGDITLPEFPPFFLTPFGEGIVCHKNLVIVINVVPDLNCTLDRLASAEG